MSETHTIFAVWKGDDSGIVKSDPAQPPAAATSSQMFLIAALLVAATFVVYFPVAHHGFIRFDDNIYITENCWSRRHPFVPVGWLWYTGTLVPVIGLAQVGSQAMADRYLYMPAIGWRGSGVMDDLLIVDNPE
jgi:hypothetical protein